MTPDTLSPGDEVRVVLEGTVADVVGPPIFESERVRVESPALPHPVSVDPVDVEIVTAEPPEPEWSQPVAEAGGPGRDI